MRRTNAPEWPVLHAVLAQGHTKPTHETLAETAKVAPRTVANVVGRVGAQRRVRGGRPLRLGPGLGLVLSLSLGVESLRAGLVDANGDLFHQVEAPAFPSQLDQSPEALFSRLRAAAAEVLDAGLADESLWGDDQARLLLHGAAVAWPSPVDRDARPSGSALGHPDWWRPRLEFGEPPTLRQRLSDALGDPFSASRCHALNDVNAHALAVAFDQSRERARDPDDDLWRIALIVRIGGGLGAATMQLAPHNRRRLSFIDSRLLVGTNGFAGELGHLPVDRDWIQARNRDNPFRELARIEYDRWICSCGRKHHLEAFASGAAIARRLKASGYTIPDDRRERADLIRSAIEGKIDQLQTHALQDVGRLLGRALANPILMLDPHSITLTGSLATKQLSDGVLLERNEWRNAIGDTVQIRSVGGHRGAYLGVRGAALAVIRHFVYRDFMDGAAPATPPIPFGEEQLATLRAHTVR